MRLSDVTIRRLIVFNAAMWLATGFAVLALVAGSQSMLRAHFAPIDAEIEGWLPLSLGLDGGRTLPRYDLSVEPRVLRAAQLMTPRAADTSADDRWWFPARLQADGRSYRVDLQLTGASSDSDPLKREWRIRFRGSNRHLGMRELELAPADERHDLIEALARDAARNLGLLAAPSGFASLHLNGVPGGTFFWSEGPSEALLERLGFAEGEILRPVDEEQHDVLLAGYAPTLAPEKRNGAAAAALGRLIELAREGSDDEFAREVPQLIDVEKLLSWNALAWLFGGQASEGIRRPAWFFDPVTGLVEPVFANVAARSLSLERAQLRASDAALITDRVLRLAGNSERRNAILMELVGSDVAPAVLRADARAGKLLPSLATTRPWLARQVALSELAAVRRETREALASNAGALRERLAAPQADTDELRLTSAGAPAKRYRALYQRIDRVVERSGLPLRVEGEWLVLPAGRHVLAQTLVVPPSHRLALEPGVRLELEEDVSLVTFRGMEALGTREQPIEIRAMNPSRPFGVVGVARAHERSELAYVTVSGGSDARVAGVKFSGQLAFNASDVSMHDCEVRDGHADDGLSVKRAEFRIVRSRFIDNSSDGFDSEWSNGSVVSSLFANNGDDGLDLATSRVDVSQTWFRRMGDKAISAGERSRVSVVESQLVESVVAIASKEDSRVEINGSEFRRNEIAISLYRDKPIFGSGSGVVVGGLFAENRRDFAVQHGSDLELHGVEQRETDSVGVMVSLLAPTPGPHTLQ